MDNAETMIVTAAVLVGRKKNSDVGFETYTPPKTDKYPTQREFMRVDYLDIESNVLERISFAVDRAAEVGFQELHQAGYLPSKVDPKTGKFVGLCKIVFKAVQKGRNTYYNFERFERID